MRVLHAIDSVGIYGAEAVILNLAEEQKRAGLDPVIASIGSRIRGERAIEQEAGRRGLPCIAYRMRDGFNLPGAWGLVKLARSQRVDLVHSHGYKSNILLAALPRKLRGLPVLTTLHGWTAKSAFSRLGLYRFCDQQLLPRLDAVVLVSEDLRRLPAIGRLNRDQVHYVANGIAVQAGPTALPGDALGTELAALRAQGHFVVGAIGRLSPEKNFSGLIEAVARIGADLPRLRIVILGDGPEAGALTRLIEARGLGEQVALKGYVASAQRYLPGFDVFVLPSLTEGLPITVLEAMAAATPIIASAVGGTPAALGGHGTLVRPGDTDELAAALRAAAAAPGTGRARAEAARARVAAHYGCGAMADRYHHIYRTLLDRN